MIIPILLGSIIPWTTRYYFIAHLLIFDFGHFPGPNFLIPNPPIDLMAFTRPRQGTVSTLKLNKCIPWTVFPHVWKENSFPRDIMFLDVLRIHLINFVQRCCSVTSSEWMLMMQPEFVDNLLLSLRSKGWYKWFYPTSNRSQTSWEYIAISEMLWTKSYTSNS